MIKQKFGFTLAEVLIVIGIIGVVAALTLPNLNHATGDKETVTRVKKIYSTLTEAVDRAQAIYGPYDTWNRNYKGNRSKLFADRVLEFIKISKDCGYRNITRDESCFSSDNVVFLNTSYGEGHSNGSIYGGGGWGSRVVSGGDPPRSVITSDNVSLLLNFQEVYGTYITVDIDGPKKGPNRWGYDLFIFCVDENQLKPWGSVDSLSLAYGGQGSAAWIIDFDNMDYKYINSRRICSNNTSIILDGTTNTSCH